MRAISTLSAIDETKEEVKDGKEETHGNKSNVHAENVLKLSHPTML